MKVPYSWLNDYVDINVSPTELGDLLTLTGSALEGIIVQGDLINRVVTCKFKSIEKHPDAEKLSVCIVDIGNGEDEIENHDPRYTQCGYRLWLFYKH